jgi:hypothetical protein
VFCANAIAVATKVIEMELVLPTTKPRAPLGRPTLDQAPALDEMPPTEEFDENAEATKMLEDLNATHPQGNEGTDSGIRQMLG